MKDSWSEKLLNQDKPKSPPSMKEDSSTTSEPYREVVTICLKRKDSIFPFDLTFKFRMTSSLQGFKNNMDVMANLYTEDHHQKTKIQSFREQFQIQKLYHPTSPDPFSSLKTETCEYSSQHSKGALRTLGEILEWDFKFHSAQEEALMIQKYPHPRMKSWLNHEEKLKPETSILATGWIRVEGKTYSFENLSAFFDLESGKRYDYDRKWIYAQDFVDDHQSSVQAEFEAIISRPGVLRLSSPEVTSFKILWEGKTYLSQSAVDQWRSKVDWKSQKMSFTLEKDDHEFSGELNFLPDQLCTYSLEDTDGSRLQVLETTLSRLKIKIIKKGQLLQTLYSEKAVYFESMSKKMVERF